ncbi:hypothetical protein R3P38DRAFT_220361 [Favolaschia claudopus]|uniref:Uncharacterized protein n=1 Tax=Favolaschia claudopus TaxID=2862362 RepID=A0AAV9ZTM5_9AGAR
MPARTLPTPTLASSSSSSPSSIASSSRLSSSPALQTPPSPNPTSFLQEIDVFMENIGRLVKALEDQHRERQFDIPRSSLDGGSRHNGNALALLQTKNGGGSSGAGK